MTPDPFLSFVLYDLQLIALAVFILLYAIKIHQLLRLPLPVEGGQADQQTPTGRAVAASYASILSPLAMESTRRHWRRWVVFAAYHVGIFVAISATFTIPFTPGLMTKPVRWAAAVSIALGLLAGFLKIYWRLVLPELRSISRPDDFFGLTILQVWFAVAIPAVLFGRPGWLTVYFVMTALLLVYVPVSKISHYIYWFFSRYLFGRRYGRRGVL
jgi:nitrate reductase gamma subunit